MRLESKKFLADAREAAALVEQFAHGHTVTDLSQDKLLRSAIYYQFVIIGEALSQMRGIDEATFDRISESWRIVGFRNQIIHGYQVIKDNVTWQIIQDKLPILKRELDQLLAE